MANVDLHTTLQHLQSLANDQMALYPQYKGHFTK